MQRVTESHGLNLSRFGEMKEIIKVTMQSIIIAYAIVGILWQLNLI